MLNKTNYKSLDYQFGLLLQSLRQKARLTQAELAELAGVSQRTVAAWEGGNNYPQPLRLRRLLEIFLKRGGFSSGAEQSEARNFWEKATSGKIGEITTFDVAWFNGLLAAQLTASEVSKTETARPWRDDWYEAVDVPSLYGRELEVSQLKSWIINEHCRTIALLGMGGIGKTSLAVTLARQIAPSFDILIFRSLLNAPPLSQLLDSLIRALAPAAPVLPTTLSAKISLVLECLHQTRALIILDNLESILQPGLAAGHYRAEYAEYGNFIRQLAETGHPSCLIVTSREKPHEIARLETKDGAVRSLVLAGLDQTASQKLLADMLIGGAATELNRLINRYSGNPLALKLVAEPLVEIFGGDLKAFLASEGGSFSGVNDLLGRQFARLSMVEQDVLYWLAISREPQSIENLSEQSLVAANRWELVAALEALRRRFLIVRTEQANRFILQAVIMEYVTERLLNLLQAEITEQTPELLCRYSLLQNHQAEYVRQNQRQSLLQPLLAALLARLKTPQMLSQYLADLLTKLRPLPRHLQGYAAGNIVNLLVQLYGDLANWDLHGLNIWQADLRGVALHKVNLAGADLRGTIFSEAFDIVLSLAFSPDGQLLASAASDGTICLWELAEGSCLTILNSEAKEVRGLAFSPDGKLLATGGDNGQIYLWQVAEGQLITKLEACTGGLMALAFSPDGQTLASAGFDDVIKLWDVSRPTKAVKMRASLVGHTSWLTTVAFSPDGNLLASSGGDQTIRLWSTKSGECLRVLSGHTAPVMALAFNPSSTDLISGGIDQTIRVWSLAKNEAILVLPTYNSSVIALAFNPNGKTFASTSGELPNVRLWSSASYQVLNTLHGYNSWVNAVAISPDGHWLVAAGMTNRLLIWALAAGVTQTPARIFIGHNDFITSVAFSPDSQFFASAGADNLVKLWHPVSGNAWRIMSGHSAPVMTLAFSPDGNYLASGSEDGYLIIWSVITGDCLLTVQAHPVRLRSVVFSLDGRTVFVSGEDGFIHAWHINKREIKPSLSWNSKLPLVMVVAASPIDNKLASGGADGVIILWDSDKQVMLAHLEGHQGAIWALAFSPDGTTLASAGDDGIIRLWEVASGVLIRQFEHKGRVMTLAFRPDGAYLVSGGANGEIIEWPVLTNEAPTKLAVYQLYEGLDISNVTGLTLAQHATLQALGAVAKAID